MPLTTAERQRRSREKKRKKIEELKNQLHPQKLQEVEKVSKINKNCKIIFYFVCLQNFKKVNKIMEIRFNSGTPLTGQRRYEERKRITMELVSLRFITAVHSSVSFSLIS